MFANSGKSKVSDFEVQAIVGNMSGIVSGALKISKKMYAMELLERKLLEILNGNSGEFYVRESKHIFLSDILKECYAVMEDKLIKLNSIAWYEEFYYIDLLINEECESAYYKLFRRIEPKGFAKIAMSCYKECQAITSLLDDVKLEIEGLIQSNNDYRVGLNIKDLKIADFKPELGNKYKYIIFHLKLVDSLIGYINAESNDLKVNSDIPNSEHIIFSSYIKLNLFVTMLRQFVDAIGYIHHRSTEDFKRYNDIAELIY